MTYEALLRPLTIGSEIIPNRFGLGPINPGFSYFRESQAPSIRSFYRMYAENGLGIVYLGGVAINSRGRSNSHSLVMREKSTKRLVESIARDLEPFGTSLLVQLMHSGRQASSREIGARPIAASEVVGEYYDEVPKSATTADIRRIVADFVSASVAVQASGCKFVEVHAAHGYLLSGFLSPSSNIRVDQYGGSVENRFRIVREILSNIKRSTTLTVGIRVNVHEYGPDGLKFDDLYAGLVGCLGYIDFISVSAGVYALKGDLIIPSRSMGGVLWGAQSKALRALGVPVFLAGNINDIAQASNVIESGEADVALMVRSLLADPKILSKARMGQEADVQPCTELYLCKYHSRRASHVYCPHNPIMRADLRPTVAKREPGGPSGRELEPK
jgi:2,4-dienoyl-CoA reductase-like NADH-dependent reductase (Old Yellow Enzyme family)